MTAALDIQPRTEIADAYAWQVVVVAEQWRQRLKLSHGAFVRLLQRSDVEWANMRAGRRGPSASFTGTLRRAIHERERGTLWPHMLDAAIQADTLQRLA